MKQSHVHIHKTSLAQVLDTKNNSTRYKYNYLHTESELPLFICCSTNHRLKAPAKASKWTLSEAQTQGSMFLWLIYGRSCIKEDSLNFPITKPWFCLQKQRINLAAVLIQLVLGFSSIAHRHSIIRLTLTDWLIVRCSYCHEWRSSNVAKALQYNAKH